MSQHNAYITYEKAWTTKLCPQCNQEPAIGHGWLFREAPPRSIECDTRIPFGEVFLHDDREDCIVLAQTHDERGSTRRNSRLFLLS